MRTLVNKIKSPIHASVQYAVATVSLLTMVGCTSGQNATTTSAAGSPTQMSNFDVNKFAINKLVCNPLGSPTTGDITNGLQADLYYKGTSQANFSSVNDFFVNGTRSEQYLFFNDINVPTRNFDTGFPTQSGALVADDQGNKLFEWFAFKMKSSIQLNYPADGEGYYQLAVLSDDGAILSQVNSDGSLTPLINNDGVTPTRMGCGTTAIKMSVNTPIPIQYSYFQGPRYQIASVLMWRPVTSASAPLDASCGQSGNYTFFDPDNNSAPTATYNALITRGWKPLVAANFNLTGVSGINPCVEGQVPAITNFNATELALGTLQFTWTTDIPSTSQVLLINEADGSQMLTLADNTMSVLHSVTVPNITLNVNFMAQAVSISSTYGKAMSSGYNFQEVP